MEVIHQYLVNLPYVYQLSTFRHVELFELSPLYYHSSFVVRYFEHLGQLASLYPFLLFSYYGVGLFSLLLGKSKVTKLDTMVMKKLEIRGSDKLLFVILENELNSTLAKLTERAFLSRVRGWNELNVVLVPDFVIGV